MLEEHTEVEGCTGQVLWIDPDNESQGRGVVAERGEWLIRSNGLPLRDKVNFSVVSVEGMILIVTQDGSRQPESKE